VINFNVPPFVGKEQQYIKEAIENNHKISGDGPFTKSVACGLKKILIQQKLC
jgi:dTDP-4-amino-4,6-dideoxygalactose transaminase